MFLSNIADIGYHVNGSRLFEHQAKFHLVTLLQGCLETLQHNMQATGLQFHFAACGKV